MKQPQFYPLIPDQAFLLILDSNDMVRSKQRLVFEGNTTYSEPEYQKLNQFKLYLEKKNITLDPFWDESLRLRFLQSCQYNSEKTVKDMAGYLDWIRKKHPLPCPPEIENALKQGFIYCTGRDFKYRPIIVFDVKKTLDSQISTEQVIDIYTYYLQYVVSNLLVEGHVQNWVLIVDLNGSGGMSTLGMLQKVISAMSNRFRCRMHSCHIIRSPGAFSWIWSLVKKFLDSVTIQKISISSKNKPENLLTKCNPSQIEKKYEGTMTNITNFWPMIIRSRVYDIENQQVSLMSVEEYKKHFQNKQLKNQKINKNFVQVVQNPNPNPKQKQNQRQRQRQRQRQKQKQKQVQKQNQLQKSDKRYSFFQLNSQQNVAARQVPGMKKAVIGRQLKNTLYNLHPSSIQQNKKKSDVLYESQSQQMIYQCQISEQGSINQIINFLCNKNKPLTFSSYAL